MLKVETTIDKINELIDRCHQHRQEGVAVSNNTLAELRRVRHLLQRYYE